MTYTRSLCTQLLGLKSLPLSVTKTNAFLVVVVVVVVTAAVAIVIGGGDDEGT